RLSPGAPYFNHLPPITFTEDRTMEKIRDASDATHISCDFRTEKDYRDDRALCPPVTRLQAQWWHGWNIFGRSLLVGLRRCLFQRIVEDSSSNTPTPQR